MYAFRQMAIFLALSAIFVLSGGLPTPGFVGPGAALAQQFKEPFQFATTRRRPAWPST
jgi:hypothetical protein